MHDLIEKIREKAVALNGTNDVADEILALVGESRFVLIGEASHGTHEFYESRAEITKRLIAEKNFSVVAVEADFPDAFRVNRYVRGLGNDATANEALSDFQRFPLWMWRNAVVLDFVDWLRAHNNNLETAAKIGFYGIDLYSLHASMEAVLNYLDKVDPEAAKIARSRYECFDHFGEDAQSYGYAASYDQRFSCEDEAVNQLVELQRRAAEYANRDGFVARDEYFFAEQNARLVKNSEEYYRSMFRGRISSWNLRDRHMAETLHALAAHLEEQGQPPKIVVWAHNSHLGDARATEMGERGEWNVGQLVRERYKNETCLIGFSTHAGTVAAADNWDEPAQLKKVRPSRKDSYEQIFHQTELPQFFLNLRDEEIQELLRRPQLERAIGVIYRPETERVSHYFTAVLSEQFDGIIHFDETRAVEPLDKVGSWSHEDLPETFPEGL
ncbi:MAG: erythromycin esterase family protein [Acidobacteria bacterium]|nr:erythromycin esterase family protein [Acidobacteriota bacterium]MCA1638619.1 erythromycin esterase family protein [Acidobacteriota bacterium]